MSCTCSVENSTFGFPREVRCEAGEGDLGEREVRGGDFGRRADVSTCRTVRGSDGGAVARRAKPVEWKALAFGVEEMVHCEHMLALLTNILQRHWSGRWIGEIRAFWGSSHTHCVRGQLGRADAVRRGHTVRGVKDTDLHGDPWTRTGGDEGREGICFENYETEIRFARCTRQGSVEVTCGRTSIMKRR